MWSGGCPVPRAPVPFRAITAEPTEHHTSSTHLAQRRHPVVQEPHPHPTARRLNLRSHGPREIPWVHERKVLLFDRDDDRLARGLWTREEGVERLEDGLERRALRVRAVICDQPAITQ